jgi:hypothetical protein
MPSTSRLDAKENSMSRIVAATVWAAFVVVTAVGSAHAQGPRFTLSGVVVVEGGGRAWLQEPQLTNNQPVSVRPGESIGPYRLTKVLEDRVELEGPGGAISVLLAGVQAPATAAAPAPPKPFPTVAPAQPVDSTGPDRVVILPPSPPLAPLPPGTPRADFESLLRGVTPHK